MDTVMVDVDQPRLSLDVLQKVVLELDARDDIISLAQTSRALSALIIPNHIQYHVLQAPYSNKALWDHLVARPDLAANVRALVLYDGTSLHAIANWRVPSIVQKSGPGDDPDALGHAIITAFRNMNGLRSFKLDAPCLGPDPRTFSTAMDVLHLAATHLPSVTDFTISLPFPFRYPSTTEEDKFAASGVLKHSLWHMKNITRLDVQKYDAIYTVDPTAHTPLVGNMFIFMLQGCTALQELRLRTIPEYLSSGLANCRLPALRHLYVTAQDTMSFATEERVIQFLRAHDRIETFLFTLLPHVRWGSSIPEPCPILPNLKHLLDAPPPFIMPIFNGRPDRSFRLETFGDFHILQITSILGFSVLHRQSVRRIGLSHVINLSTLRLASSMLPAVEILDLPPSGNPMYSMPQRGGLSQTNGYGGHHSSVSMGASDDFPLWYRQLYDVDEVTDTSPKLFEHLVEVSNVRTSAGFVPDYRDWLRGGTPERPFTGEVDRAHVEAALRAISERHPRLRVVNGWRIH